MLVAACADPSRPTEPASAEIPTRPDGLATGEVTWIADGDTLDVEIDGVTVEVRLVGINTPERDECYSDEPLDFLIEHVKNKEVAIESVAIDQFNRTLANVWIGEELINLTLVTQGLAIAQTPDEENPYGELMTSAEEKAFDESAGLWSPTACADGSSVYGIEIDLDASSVNPAGPDDTALDEEYVVLVNRGSTIVDMSGWVLRDESSRNRLVFRAGTTIDQNERLTIASGCSTEPGWCGSQSIWNNDGDLVLLLDQNGTVMARARY